MAVDLWLQTLVFSSGRRIDLDPAGTTILVGPNNSGKTSTLREIRQALAVGKTSPVLRDVEFKKTGSAEEISDWLKANTVETPDDDHSWGGRYEWMGARMSSDRVHHKWLEPTLGDLAPLLCTFADVERRLAVTSPAPPKNYWSSPPDHSFHILLADEEAEAQIASLARDLFNTDFKLYRGSGEQIVSYCGDIPKLEEGESELSEAFLRRLRELPTLHEQGHGLRSAVGCILELLSSRAFVDLIDEPEVFLHPPQAYQLGRRVLRVKRSDTQLIIATHSADFLRGVLDGDISGLKVVRISRSARVNEPYELDVEGVRRLWADPILRFSNVLDGLFHDSVVICESDSDCRFYRAVSQALNPSQVGLDILFVATGGKDRLATAASALKSVGVPVQVVADFDVLRSEQPLRRIVESLGGAWGSVGRDWDVIRSAIDRRKPALSKQQVRLEMTQVLAATDGDWVTPEITEKLRRIVKTASPWSDAKQHGVGAVPAGEDSLRLKTLLARFRQIGLFVVECGEIERFLPTVSGHGPRWVAEALRRDLADDPELEAARGFVRSLVGISTERPSHQASTAPTRSTPPDTEPRRSWRRTFRSRLRRVLSKRT